MSGFSLWLYGSQARGDGDELSDVDLLLVADAEPHPDEITAKTPPSLTNASVTQYGWAEVEEMASYGSLFLHHVRLEGHPLYESSLFSGRLVQILDNVGPYLHARKDISGFRAVLTDAEQSLNTGGPQSFELSVVATVIRHASILACWLLGKPCFGRVAPVDLVVRELGMCPELAREFPGLYQYRLYNDGRIESAELPIIVDCFAWIQRGMAMIDKLEELVDD